MKVGLVNRGNIVPLICVAVLTSHGANAILERVIDPGMNWTYVIAFGVVTWAWLQLYDFICGDIVHTSIRGTLSYLIEKGVIEESDVDFEDE